MFFPFEPDSELRNDLLCAGQVEDTAPTLTREDAAHPALPRGSSQENLLPLE